MKLLVVTETLDPPDQPEGGLARYVGVTTPALIARGHTVRFIVRNVRGGVPFDAVRCAWPDEREPPDPQAGAFVRREIAAWSPDACIVHTVMDAAVVEAALDAPRSIGWIHDHRPFCPNGNRRYPRGGGLCALPMGGACLRHSLLHGCVYGPRLRTAQALRRRERLRDAYARYSAVAVASHAIGDEAAANGIVRARIAQLGLPLPAEAFAERIAASPERPVVVFAGRVVEDKGLADAVHAIAAIGAATRPRLHVLGDGPALAGARELAARCGVSLHADGFVSAEHVRAALDAATLLVLPTLYGEPFGYAGIEAFARGRPVAAYAGGGVATWLREGAGIAVTAGDRPALGAAIERLADPAAWPAASAAAFACAQAYRLEAHLDAFEHLLAGTA